MCIVNQTGSDSISITIPLAILTLVFVSLIAGFIFHLKRKQRERNETEAGTVDKNPVYGREVYKLKGTGRGGMVLEKVMLLSSR